jgi:hypothetical protein
MQGIGVIAPAEKLKTDRGAWIVPLGPSGATLHVKAQQDAK